MIEAIQDARKVIKPHVIRTPMVLSPTISSLFDCECYLKLENLQKTGSFKIRGAAYKLLKKGNGIGKEGVVAASAGNHAQGVALAARTRNIPATIIMPDWASITKQEATKSYGGEVLIYGKTIEESLSKANEIASSGKTLIHPFDDSDIIAGQGTVGLEILEDIKEPDIVVVPIGGGGLISGIAEAIKANHPLTKIIGVETAVCPSARESLIKRKPVVVQSGPSIADGISVKQIGGKNFDIVKNLVDDVVLVEEEQIAAAILMLLEQKKILAEGAGAVSLAAVMNKSIAIPKGAKVVLVISGGNVDSSLLGRIINQGLSKHGRILRFQVTLTDTPGALATLLNLVAELKANVLHIYHDRNVRDLPINITRVNLEVETRGQEHIDEILSAIEKAGYTIVQR